MIVSLSDLGKRYNTEWIFRHLNATLSPDNPTVVLGANGSGKSTLLQLIAGYYVPSEGSVSYALDGNDIAVEDIHAQVALATPYLELYDTLTFRESVEFQAGFKPFRDGLSVKDVVGLSGLPGNKPMKQFSSGMRQRAKVTLAVLSNAGLLLLDEPTANLDHAGVTWYQELVLEHLPGRTVVVCSNEQKGEYAFCTQEIRVGT